MKKIVCGLFILVVGCSTWMKKERPHSQDATLAGTTNGAVVAGSPQFKGAAVRVTVVNEKYKFVVLDYTGRMMPGAQTILTVYRDGNQVGRVQIHGPSSANRATADILDGDVWVGDWAR